LRRVDGPGRGRRSRPRSTPPHGPFAPDYPQSERFYVDYTGSGGDLHIVQYRRAADDPNLAPAASARTVLTIPHRIPSTPPRVLRDH
jgi:hypothetical protein